jgi:hypothetical protein
MQVNDSALQLTLAPFKRAVPKGTGETVIWHCGHGIRFPESDYFAWKPGAIDPPAVPTRSADGKRLTLTYDNGPDTPPQWSYTIAVQDEDNPTLIVTIDPDIDNQPPGERYYY